MVKKSIIIIINTIHHGQPNMNNECAIMRKVWNKSIMSLIRIQFAASIALSNNFAVLFLPHIHVDCFPSA